MLPKKYHAIAFIGVLVMLLLLGLHLLGIGFSTSQALARSEALAKNASSSQPPSSSASNQNSQVYRHPIVYDKLTGATDNQINDVLGAPKLPARDYPIDHYQQQQIQMQLNQPPLPFNPHQLPPQQDDVFFGHHRPPGFPPHPMHNGMGRPGGVPPNGGLMMPPPPQPPLPPTTQSPPAPVVSNPLQPATTTLSTPFEQQKAAPSNHQDSVPSASNLSDNGARAMPNQTNLPLVAPENQGQYSPRDQNFNQQLQHQPQQPVYYTPPIFAYNQDPHRPLGVDLYNPQLQQQANGAQLGLPLGPPEAPMTIDEYQARQARLGQQRQQPSHQTQPSVLPTQTDRYGASKLQQVAPNHRTGQEPNLLADPQQQARHKQQMLDRQLLFGNPYQTEPAFNQTGAYYPDPALYRLQPPAGNHMLRAPPYAHNMANSAHGQHQPDLASDQFLRQPAQSRVMNPPPPQQQSPPVQHQPAKLVAPPSRSQTPPPSAPSGPQASTLSSSTSQSSANSLPLCARQAIEIGANSSNASPVLFCNDDSEYPSREIMRALEMYANERTIEQLLPQSLVQLHLSQRPSPSQGESGALSKSGLLNELARGQLIMDPMQPNINLPPMQQHQSAEPGSMQQIVASGQYEPMCRSLVFLAQPRRARNLVGQWKVIVNLPGHKYRGIAISQMVRIEECSRPNSECQSPGSPSQSSVVLASVAARTQQAPPTGGGLLAKSRCLQQYENQRLVAWSHQQGLHLDIFRVPIACSCHIHR